ncbi:stalk domain-containing protein [Marinicrinis lubricantis]|uniref:Stalk domain-containing protein n=1 Tax=Marinicrinis lubricantis TaxID=2086470 RepID=A0ABW1IRR9_9BACL
MRTNRSRWMKAVWLGILAFILTLGSFAPTAEAAGQMEIISSEHELVDGKMKVTVDVHNAGSGQKGGVAVVGHDEQGNPIEVKTNYDYLTSNETAVFEVFLDSGALVKSVEVIPTGNQSKISLLAFGSRMSGGYLEVTGAVENGGAGEVIGLVASGYDKNGKLIEVRGADNYLTSNEPGTFTVQLKHADLIDSVQVEVTGNASHFELINYGSVLKDGVLEATASVENGGSGQNVGVVFEGYDKNGVLIETTSADQYLTGHEVGNYEVTFDAGAHIASVKAFAAGDSIDLKLLSHGSRIQDGKRIVTAAVENGSSGQTVSVIVHGYDAKGQLIEVSGGSGYFVGKEISTFETVLNAGSQVKFVRVYTEGTEGYAKGWGYGIYQKDGRKVITGALTNGNKGQKVTVKIVPYNSKGQQMTVHTDDAYFTSGEAGIYEFILTSGTARASVVIYNEDGSRVPIASFSAINVEIDGVLQQYEQPPVNHNGNILVPMRAIFEALGSEIKWDQATQTVTSEKDGTVVVLRIGSKQATMSGQNVTLNAAPAVVNQTTMVPIRFVSEALGADVKWDSSTQTVIIQTTPASE